jgi:uncharacterized protein (TIGR00290 family)
MSKSFFHWSSGKDAALALYHAQQSNAVKIDRLVTTINGSHNRVTMHGLRTELLIQQANAINLPLDLVQLPEQPTMEEYEEIISRTYKELRTQGYDQCGFGDIFLEDLRAYREKEMHPISCYFPLWKKNTTKLVQEFEDLGFKAVIISLNASLLNKSFLGRTIDRELLRDLPPNVDPCGENGEFHTFCYDGPIFKQPVSFKHGNATLRTYPSPNNDETKHTGFWFLDLI